MGAAAFLLMALSDLLKVRGLRRAPLLFSAGGALLALATVFLIAERGFGLPAAQPWRFAFLLPGIAALGLLAYTVCFAVPGGAPEEDGLLPLTDDGVYALCRHPGVLWLSAFYLSLWGFLGGNALCAAWLLFTGLDICYVFWQDRKIFPKTIQGYRAYRQRTPFLLPGPAEIRLCFRQLRARFWNMREGQKGSRL